MFQRENSTFHFIKLYKMGEDTQVDKIPLSQSNSDHICSLSPRANVDQSVESLEALANQREHTYK